MSIIEIKNFSKKYGGFLAVNNINLTIEEGEIVGFVGKNGAGKSTTIRSLMNMISPTKGQILIDKLDCVKDSKEIKSKLSYMSGENEFYNNLKAIDLFKFVLKFSDSTMEDVEKLAKCFELNMNKKMCELSLGNKKKVSIIQALLKKANIIILDEPTNGLDPLMQKRFFDLLLKEKKKGSTIFLSSHNLEDINRYCDKVAIIKDGEIVDFLNMSDINKKQKQIVSYLTVDGKKEEFELNEDINELIIKLSKINIEKLEIRDKSIEEEFIGYYEEEKQ